MLDTNVVSALVRDPTGKLRRRADAFGLNDLCLSIVTAGEIEFGIARSGSRRIRVLFDAVLKAMEVLPLLPPVEQRYGQLRSSLATSGNPIGPNDTWIAAHALALDFILVTANIGEFSRVPNLRVENWLD